jgi:RHS repeat-associated protein
MTARGIRTMSDSEMRDNGMETMKKLPMIVALFLCPVVLLAQDVQYYHLDAIGNVRAVTDQSGAIVERHDYLPFGEECTTGAGASSPGLAGGQPRHFTGKERDVETGLDYFGARYYGSGTGRFTTTDPALDIKASSSNPQKWNRYAYALNNPLRYVDPDGRQEGAALIQDRDVRALASGRLSLAEYNARIKARAGGAVLGLAIVGVAIAPALAAEASIAASRCGTSAACQNLVTGLAEGISGAAPGSMGTIPTLTGTANRELFTEALGYVRASAGTAGEKASLFEALAEQIEKKTAGSWSATRYSGADGSHVFVGGAGETLVIDSSGALFKGRAQTGLVAAGKNSFRPNYDVLRKVD